MYQESEIEYYKMQCAACNRAFYEVEALKHCPHCAAEIDEDNLGEKVEVKVTLNTRTGEMQVSGRSQK